MVVTERIFEMARAVDPSWWNDDIALLDFSRVLLAYDRKSEEALLRQALNYCEEVACSGVSLGTEMETMRARLACLLLERLGLTTSSSSRSD
jgi:hypothetical protein